MTQPPSLAPSVAELSPESVLNDSLIPPDPPPAPYEMRVFGDWGARHVVMSLPLIRGTEHTEHPKLDFVALYRPHGDDNSYDGLRSAILEEFHKYAAANSKDTDLSCLLSAPPELAQAILDFHYTGNRKFARHFFESCWPAHRPGKRRYWRALMKLAAKDKYWRDITAWNNRIEQNPYER